MLRDIIKLSPERLIWVSSNQAFPQISYQIIKLQIQNLSQSIYLTMVQIYETGCFLQYVDLPLRGAYPHLHLKSYPIPLQVVPYHLLPQVLEPISRLVHMQLLDCRLQVNVGLRFQAQDQFLYMYHPLELVR